MRRTLRRALSPLFMAACMSSVRRSLSGHDREARGLVEAATPCRGRTRVALHVALHGGGFLALAFLGGFLVELAAAQLGQDAGFFTGTFEAAQALRRSARSLLF